MKRQKMLSSMDLIDEKYIEEASPDKKKSRRGFWVKAGSIAAAAAIMVTSLSVWLFTPLDKNPPDVSAYKNSQYYPLIQKLNELTFKKPKHNNRFELYTDTVADVMFAAKEQAESPATNRGPSYVETTDNQVSGVIEADIIKRSDKHIFYLRRNELSVYPINGTDTECLSTFTVNTENSHYSYGVEMYLSEDCSALSVILPCYSGRKHMTQIVSLDVTDPANVTEKERITVSGSYVSSRLTEGKLLLVTNFSVPQNPDFSDESSFVPEVTTKDGVIKPNMDDILCPENATSSSFAVVTMVKPQNMELIGSVACLSYSYNVYASADSLYLTRSYNDRTIANDTETVTSLSDISRVSYSDEGLEIKGSITVKGSINDQYSLDEFNGVLRVAVTTRTNKYSVKYSYDYEVESFIITGGKTNASLYCLDKETFDILAAVENFAPEGEELRSARFDGNMAYICTSIQLSDPVFFFDLSDLDNITFKDTGTIEGFSSSLVDFGDGYLLGIGVGSTWNTVKIEIYTETATGVKSVCSKEINNSGYSNTYKSYFIDRDNWMVGLLICPYSEYSTSEYYLLLHFDGAQLVTILQEDLRGSTATARAVLADGCFYMFTDQAFKVKEIN